MDQNKIGKFIERARKARHLTQQQLADILGVSNTAISKWENGNNLPDISMLEPLSIALKIDMLDLLTAQNSTHTQVSKKCVKQRRNRITRVIITIIIAIILLLTTNFLTYYNCNKTTQKILSEQIQVYKISSSNIDYVVEGYIIFNNKENLVYIEKIAFQGLENPNIDYSKIKEVNYYLELNGYKIFKQTSHIEEKANTLEEIFMQYRGNSYIDNNNPALKNTNIETTELIIQMTDKKGDKSEISVPIILKKTFI